MAGGKINLKLPKLMPTKWSFVSSGGGSLVAPIFKALYLGGSIGNFYAKEDGKTKVYRMPYSGADAGLGLGKSVGKGIGITLSEKGAPGGGFRIYRHPLRKTQLQADDFQGPCLSITGAASVLTGASLTLLFFGASDILGWGGIVSGPLFLPAFTNAAIYGCEGVGILWSSTGTNAVGIAAELFLGEIGDAR
jgi:hypothetical protein